MSLRQSALRFQCLYTTARQRIANLQQRSSSHGHADLSYSTASYAPLRSTLRSTKASSVASIAPSRPVNPFRTRPFSTSKPSYDKPKTVQQARSRYVVGVCPLLPSLTRKLLGSLLSPTSFPQSHLLTQANSSSALRSPFPS